MHSGGTVYEGVCSTQAISSAPRMGRPRFAQDRHTAAGMLGRQTQAPPLTTPPHPNARFIPVATSISRAIAASRGPSKLQGATKCSASSLNVLTQLTADRLQLLSAPPTCSPCMHIFAVPAVHCACG